MADHDVQKFRTEKKAEVFKRLYENVFSAYFTTPTGYTLLYKPVDKIFGSYIELFVIFASTIS